MVRAHSLENWLFQQRDAFWRFIGQSNGVPGPHHVSRMLQTHPEIAYRGHSERLEGYISDYHCKPSRVVLLHFASDGQHAEIPFPAPREDGVFVINGQEYVAPLQRLVWNSQTDPPLVEYRRIDQALADAWTRQEMRYFGNRTRAEEFNRRDTPGAFRLLCGYVRNVLLPESSPADLLQPLEGNRWNALARQCQIRTLRVRRHKNDGSSVSVGSCKYRSVSSTTMYGESVRVGTFVGDDRELHCEEKPTVGLLPRCVPFLQHNDPRRVLMACSMMTQAQPVADPEEPVALTDFERALRHQFPKMIENMGVNLRVGFVFWKGLNYEDAIVVSESGAKELRILERREVSVPVPAFAQVDETTDRDFERGIRRVGSAVREGDDLLRLCYRPLRLGVSIPKLPESLQSRIGPFPADLHWGDHTLCSPVRGRIAGVSEVPLWSTDAPCASRYRSRFDFSIETERPLQVGDKLCNRHGNKGVVSAIIPDEEMPQVDGQHLEVLFNPIGLLNRGNYGQLLEAIVGAAHVDESDFPTGLVDPPGERIERILQACAGQQALIFNDVEIPGPAGTRTVRAVTGINYVLRLPHHAEEKFSVYGTGKYSSITGQPPVGIAQKYGEMEMWALQAHGAHSILAELCHDRSRQEKPPKNGEPTPQQPLRDWLAALGLRIELAGEEVSLRRMDLHAEPTGWSNLLDTSLSCDADPMSEADGKGEVPPLRTVLWRLSSEVFFDEHGLVYLDLGKLVDIVLTKRRSGRGDDVAEEEVFAFSGRYLPLLSARYRRSPTGRGEHPLTTAYAKLARAVWRLRRGQEPGKDEGVEEALKTVLWKLLGGLDGKHGIIRRVGLCRRLEYSARMVIVPDPELTIGEVSLPWDAVRVLFRDRLMGSSACAGAIDTAQSDLEASAQSPLAEEANRVLRSEWVLANRNPSLHKYSILAFRPVVHFDSMALKIPPLVTSSFNADFDGDQMSVVPVFTEAARHEAEKLSVKSHLFSAADGELTIPLTKDLRLGLSTVAQDSELCDRLNHALAAAGCPDVTDSADDFDQVLRHGHVTADRATEYLELLTEHALEALDRVEQQSALGRPEALARFWSLLTESGAAKDRLGDGGDTELVRGVPLSRLTELASERIGIMIAAKVAVGDFGGYLRRLCYRFQPHAGSGLVFDDPLRHALVSAQSITARATQCALSPKSGNEQLRYHPYHSALEACLTCEGRFQDLPEFSDLCSWLGFGPEQLAAHLSAIRKAIGHGFGATDLLHLLDDPGSALTGHLPLAGQTDDPRIALFLA